MNDAQTMDAAQVWRQIAELRGWTNLRWVEPPRSKPYWFGTDPDGYGAIVPDWTNDAGAALALCLDVLGQLNAQSEAYEFYQLAFDDDSVSFQQVWSGEVIDDIRADKGHDAINMAKVALEALNKLAALQGGDA